MKKPVSESKGILRQQVKACLRELSPEFRQQAAASAGDLLRRQEVWKSAHSILFYAPMADELNVWPVASEALASGKMVLLLRYNFEAQSYEAVRIEDMDKSLLRGKFGIMEPTATCSVFPLNRLDLTLVPGLAFDATGGRLGRGGGFYDRLLAHVSGVKCGVAFDEQLVPQVPMEPHDIKLDVILTPTRWLNARAAVA